jgi:hypothetical protein
MSTSRKEIENMHESKGSRSAAALAYLLGYNDQNILQLHMGCQTPGATGAHATHLFDMLDDNPGMVQAMVEWVLDRGRDSEGAVLTDDDDEETCDDCGQKIDEEGECGCDLSPPKNGIGHLDENGDVPEAGAPVSDGMPGSIERTD